MVKKSEISRDDFESLLSWLHPEPENAGRKYELIRSALIRIFLARGCPAAEELADVTIDRVAGKVTALAQSYQGKPEFYFYGVANNMLLEFRRKPKSVELSAAITAQASSLNYPDPENEISEDYSACLEQCLSNIGDARRQLILKYYQYDNHEKLAARQRLAADLNLTINALRIQATRARSVLRQCISECVGIKNSR